MVNHSYGRTCSISSESRIAICVLWVCISRPTVLEREIDLAPKQIGHFATFGEFTDDDLRALFAEIEKDLLSLPTWARAAKRYYLEGIRQRLLPSESKRAWNNPKCVALRAHLRIFPNGDVPTCQFNTKTIGNLKEKPFQEIWRSLKADSQREWVRACPGCWAECEVLPSAIYTLDLVKARKQEQRKIEETLVVGARRDFN